jgi:hypothetical protein
MTSCGAAGSNAFAEVSAIVPWLRRAGQLFPKRAILFMKRFTATPPLPPLSLGTPPRKRLVRRPASLAASALVAAAAAGMVAASPAKANPPAFAPVCGAVPLHYSRCFSLKVLGSERCAAGGRAREQPTVDLRICDHLSNRGSQRSGILR